MNNRVAYRAFTTLSGGRLRGHDDGVSVGGSLDELAGSKAAGDGVSPAALQKFSGDSIDSDPVLPPLLGVLVNSRPGSEPRSLRSTDDAPVLRAGCDAPVLVIFASGSLLRRRFSNSTGGKDVIDCI